MYSWFKNRADFRQRTESATRGNITFGQTTFSRTFRTTGAFLKRQFWVWPILAVIALSFLGFFVNSSIRSSIESSLKSELSTLLHVEKSMLEKWLQFQEANAVALANQQEIRSSIIQLIELQTAFAEGKPTQKGEVVKRETIDDLAAKLKQILLPNVTAHNFAGYVVLDRDQKVIAAQTPELVGQTIQQYRDWIASANEGESTVSPPFPSAVMLRDRNGTMRADVPTMFAAAPIRNEDFQTVAVLGFRINPEREFTDILQLGQMGKTGETYAFDKNGLLVSNSRFDEQLMLAGLIPDRESAMSILNVHLKDPGGNLLEGHRAKVRRSELPFTVACESALQGGTGVSLEGNRNYRGIPSVAAWTWIPKYKIGLITEMDYSEAFRPLSILRWVFISLFSLLIATSIAILIFSIVLARMQREAREAAIEAKELGQYRLETLLGSGAMGIVYKGHHAMLRRQTAIKLLKSENVSSSAIERFEHEVQITCQLNNPHTIAIYDYGRTPEGVFYYAMEFLDGINLQNLVEQYGPQPPARVISILEQICSSLYEAHSLGLVHRDIKPANIMLNRRGGECDVVKVLDFGLVRSLDEESSLEGNAGMTGTPMYMSPEAIQSPKSVDVRSDIYSLGAVGYFLLTGQPLYQATTLGELFQHHIDSLPTPPSQTSEFAIPSALENAIMACLEKNRANRPQTAKELSTRLEDIECENAWKREDAESWWNSHDRESKMVAESSAAGTTPPALNRSSDKHKDAPKTLPLTSKPSTSAKTVSDFEATMLHRDSEE